MDTLIPRAVVKLSGVTLDSFGMAGFLRNLRVERVVDRSQPAMDRAHGRAKRGNMSISLNNLDGQLAGVVAIRERVDIWLGYGTELFYRGSFRVTRPSFSFADSAEINLAGEDESADLVSTTSGLRFHKSTTVEEVVRKVAERHKLRHAVHPDVASIQIGTLDQHRHENDWLFLDRALYRSGAGWLYIEPSDTGDSQIVVKPFTETTPLYRSAGSADRPSSELFRLGYRTKDADWPIKSAEVHLEAEDATDVEAGEVSEDGLGVTFTSALGEESAAVGVTPQKARSSRGVANTGRTKTATFFSPEVTSLAKIEDAAAFWREHNIRISVALYPGLPFLYPNMKVLLLGVGPFSGEVIIVSVEDTWGPDGYRQNLQVISPYVDDPTLSDELADSSGITFTSALGEESAAAGVTEQ